MRSTKTSTKLTIVSNPPWNWTITKLNFKRLNSASEVSVMNGANWHDKENGLFFVLSCLWTKNSLIMRHRFRSVAIVVRVISGISGTLSSIHWRMYALVLVGSNLIIIFSNRIHRAPNTDYFMRITEFNIN